MGRSRRAAALGALCFPPLVTGYLVVLGYSLRETVDVLRGAAYPGPFAIYVLTLAVTGGVVGFALRRDHRLVAAGPIVYVLLTAWDPLFAPAPDGFRDVTAFAADALFLAVLSAIAVLVAWARAHPDAARTYLTPEAVRLGVVVGLIHLVVAVVLRGPVFGLEWGGRSLFSFGIAAWMLTGAFLEGAVPGFFFARHRWVTPALAVAGCFSWAAFETWQYVRMLEATGAAPAAAFTPFTFYLAAWFVVVALAALCGLGEREVKSVISRR